MREEGDGASLILAEGACVEDNGIEAYPGWKGAHASLPELGLPWLSWVFDRRNLVDAPQPTDQPFRSPQPVLIGLSVEHHLDDALIGNRLGPGKPTKRGEISRRGFQLCLSERAAEGRRNQHGCQHKDEQYDGKFEERESPRVLSCSIVQPGFPLA